MCTHEDKCPTAQKNWIPFGARHPFQLPEMDAGNQNLHPLENAKCS